MRVKERRNFKESTFSYSEKIKLALKLKSSENQREKNQGERDFNHVTFSRTFPPLCGHSYWQSDYSDFKFFLVI